MMYNSIMWKIISSVDKTHSLCECSGCHKQAILTTKYAKRSDNQTPDKVCSDCTRKKNVEKGVWKKHGGWNSPTWISWSDMRYRCNHPSAHNYKYYGAKGIRVCDRWSKPIIGFENFVKDMGERPAGCTLDRINSDGDYCPENCRWATAKEQAKDWEKIIEFNGEKHNEKDWSILLFGKNRETIVSRRLANGWSVKQALTTPVKVTQRSITYDGKTMSANKWGKKLGIKPATIIYRLNSGWSIKDTLTVPVNVKKRNNFARERAQSPR